MNEEHRLVEGRPRDLVTVLLLKSVSGQDDHFGAYDQQRKQEVKSGGTWQSPAARGGVQVLGT